MIVQNETDIKKLREIGSIVSQCLQHMFDHVSEGISTYELDQIGKAFLAEHRAKSAPIVMYGFPGHTCISLNHEAAHGIPSKNKIIGKHDLINIDVSAVKDGYFADTGASKSLDPNNKLYTDLISATKKALELGMEVARAGERINVIGKHIEEFVATTNFTIIENLSGHGIGKTLHDDPKAIPAHYDHALKDRLKHNMVITIEPFISNGSKSVAECDDGWTLINAENCYSAQFEHTMVIQKGKAPIVLT